MESTDIEEYNRATVSLTKEQWSFLKKIDNNQCAAVRKAINMLMKRKAKDVFRENLLIICMGCIFLFFATITPFTPIIIILCCFGGFISAYGIGGLISAIRRTK